MRSPYSFVYGRLQSCLFDLSTFEHVAINFHFDFFISFSLTTRWCMVLNPGQLDPAVNERFLSYLTRFIGALLRTFFVVPDTVSNCRKRPENRVSDCLRSFTIRRNMAVILRLWNESNTTGKLSETTVYVIVFDGYGGRNHCPGKHS